MNLFNKYNKRLDRGQNPKLRVFTETSHDLVLSSNLNKSIKYRKYKKLSYCRKFKDIHSGWQQWVILKYYLYLSKEIIILEGKFWQLNLLVDY